MSDVGKIEKFSSDGKKLVEIVCKVNNKDQIQKSSRLQIDLWGDIYLTQLKEERDPKNLINRAMFLFHLDPKAVGVDNYGLRRRG